jgi:hypothetical protein
MGFVDVPGRFIYPRWDGTIWNMNNAGNAQQVNAAADYLAFVFTVPKTGTLNTVHFEQTAQGSIQDLHISFQDLDSNNDPDGTADQYRVYTPTAPDINNYVSVGLITSDGTDVGTKRSVTQGDRMAVVIRFDSTAGDITFRTGATKDGTKDETAPYALFSADSGSNWTLHADWLTLMLEYETDGIVHIPDTLPVLSRNTFSAGSASSPDEIGFKFQVPFPCKVAGVMFNAQSHADVVVGIENSAGTTIAAEVAAFWEQDTATQGTHRSFYFEEAAVELEADTDYYVTWRPITTTSRTTYTWDIQDAAARAGLPWGTTSSYNTRTDGGAWTEDQTITVLMSLIISAVDDGAGGGGGGGRGAGPFHMGGALNSGQQRIF